MYVKINQDNNIETFPYSLSSLKKDYPNVSMPKNLDESVLAQFDVFKISYEPRPVISESTQKITQKTNPELVEGVWTLGWDVIEKTELEKTEYLASIEIEVRRNRNMLLNQSDWIVTFHTEKGTAIPQEWLDYRQSLRDITLQETFPINIIWPQAPAI